MGWWPKVWDWTGSEGQASQFSEVARNAQFLGSAEGRLWGSQDSCCLVERHLLEPSQEQLFAEGQVFHW